MAIYGTRENSGCKICTGLNSCDFFASRSIIRDGKKFKVSVPVLRCPYCGRKLKTVIKPMATAKTVTATRTKNPTTDIR